MKWQPFPLPDGSYADTTRPWSAQDLVNYLPVAAELGNPRSPVNRRTVPGLAMALRLANGPIRVNGLYDAEGYCFAVAGTGLYALHPDDTASLLGTIPGTGRISWAHNQVTGGNQVVISNGSSAYVYDTRDDSQIPSSGGGTGGGGGGETTPGGGTPSTGLGPHGGYPDDTPYHIPLPEPGDLGAEQIDGGDFSDAGDISGWRKQDGTPLDSDWTVSGGKLRYHGRGGGKAYYYGARYSLPSQPFPRYTVDTEAKITTDAGVLAGIGVAQGFNTFSELPGPTDTSTLASYVTETLVTHTFAWAPQQAGMTGTGQYVLTNFMPVAVVSDETGALVDASFDDVSAVIDEVAVATTAATITNLNLGSGLTGITLIPYVTALSPSLTIVGGDLVMETLDAGGDFQHVVWDDPIDLADAVGKYIKISGEVWSDDPTLVSGIPTGGVAFGLCVKQAGEYVPFPKLGLYQRGDYTAREVWMRQYIDATGDPSITLHVCVSFKAALGKKAKLKLSTLAVEVTDDVID